MERIKQQPTQNIALRVLSWIVYAIRPLRLEEVQHAVAVDELEPDDVSISEESLTPQSIIVNACAGLIKIDKKSNIINLVHKTTQEYFDRRGTDYFPRAQWDIATTCLKYLSLEVFSDGYCQTDGLYKCRLKENALLGYAARSWGNHIHKAGEESLQDLALEFFLDKRKFLCASQALFADPGHSRSFPKNFLGVHHVAYFGLTGIMQLLLKDPEVDPDLKDSYGRTPLSWAAENGHEAAVKLLVDTDKVDVDSKGASYSQTPLSRAAENGHEAVVKLLVNTGKVDVDSKDSYSQTPLSRAAENGHEAVVKLLVNTGKVDVDSKDSHSRTPLSWAAENGHEAVVKLLVNTSKVDVDLKDDSYGRTPLLWAAVNGHEAVVKLLVNTGKVGVDSKDSYGRTPLSWAAGNGHEAVVKLLVDTGKADVDSKDFSFGRTPLSWAAGNGHEAVVKLLVDTGKVDVDSKDFYGQTPLSRAAENGHEAVVKLLRLSISTQLVTK
jgi:ankyrin repeat protein